jgi:hypothetical protein
MRARKVKGLDPEGTLGDNFERIARTRLDELYGFVPAVLEPSAVEALHDMRIASKRLRYVLEAMGPAFGPGVEHGVTEAKSLQGVLGEIHDCDVLLPRVREQLKQLRDQDAEMVRFAAPATAADLDPELMREAPNLNRYRGVEVLLTYLRVRRDVLYAHFLEEWHRLEHEGFRGQLERALSDRPAPDVGAREATDAGTRPPVS